MAKTKKADLTPAEIKRRAEQSRRDKKAFAAAQAQASPPRQPRGPRPRAPPRPAPTGPRRRQPQLPPPVRQHYTQARARAPDVARLILQATMLPGDSPPLRLPLVVPELTTVHKFRQVSNFVVEKPVSGVLSTAEPARFLIFRDPTYPVWSLNTAINSDTLTASRYLTISKYTAGILGGPSIPDGKASVPLGITNTEYFTQVGAGTDKDLFGDLVLGTTPRDPASLWYFVPRGMRPAIEVFPTGSTGLSTGAWALTLSYSKDGLTEEAQELTIDAFVLSGKIYAGAGTSSSGGWYCWRNLVCVTTPTTAIPAADAVISGVNIGWSTAGPLSGPTSQQAPRTIFEPMRAFGAAEYDTAASLYQRCRVSASALLLTNTKAANFAEGAVRAVHVRSANKAVWGATINNPSYDFTSGEQGINSRFIWTGKASEGVYSFTTPQMAGDDLRDVSHELIRWDGVSQAVSAKRNHSFFLLDYHQWYNSIHIDASEYDQPFQATYDYHLESVLDSQLWDLAPSPFTLEQARSCHSALMQIKPFTENHVHIGLLLRTALSLVHTAMRWGAPLLNPLAHRAVDALLPISTH